MVAENQGITIFPKSVVKKVDLSRVKAIPIVNPTISWKLGIILNKEKYVSYAAKEMIKYITTPHLMRVSKVIILALKYRIPELFYNIYSFLVEFASGESAISLGLYFCPPSDRE